MGSYHTNCFLTLPICSLIHIPEAETSLGFEQNKREEGTEVETWVKGVSTILYSFISLSEVRNPKYHVGKGVRNRSLGLCLDLGIKPGHPVPVVTFCPAACQTRLLTKTSFSILLKKLKFQYDSFIYIAPLPQTTYSVPRTVG